MNREEEIKELVADLKKLIDANEELKRPTKRVNNQKFESDYGEKISRFC